MTIIEDIGETITARVLTRTYNDYGDATTTAGSSLVSGLIVPMNADYNEVKSGILDTKDAIGIFAGTETSVKNGNEIYCTLGSFSIQNAQPFVLGGTIHHYECELKRILI